MSISSTVKKFMPYLKTAKDYVLYRLSSQAVEMDDGTTLEQKVTSLNSLISKKLNSANVVNNLTTTNSGYALDARQGKALNDSIASLNSALTALKISTDLPSGSVSFMDHEYAVGEVIIDGEVNTTPCTILRIRLYSRSDRSFLLGTMVATADPTWWNKYVQSTALLIQKNVGSYWSEWHAIS